MHRTKSALFIRYGEDPAMSKNLLVRDEDVQVLHGFDSAEHAAAYLQSAMFTGDVVTGLSPYFQADPEISIFTVAG